MTEDLREKVKGLYNNPTWSDRVDRMSDKQVFAVYSRLINKPTIKKA